MGNRGSGDELVKNEEGLLGIVPTRTSPRTTGSTSTGCRTTSIDREKRIGQRTVSRFTYDRAGHTIDQATRKDLLQWPVQIHSCCHAGGGMAFDDKGNLYVGSGDSNSSGGSRRLLRQQLDRRSTGHLVPGRPPHVGQHQRPQRQDHPDPPGGRRHLHDPGRATCSRRAPRRPGRRST